MFNKHLEEISAQSIMNNAIIEMKSTLEGTNSRITETEDKIREVEDRILRIRDLEKKYKRKQRTM